MGTWRYTLADNICVYDENAERLYGLTEARLLHDDEGVKAKFHPDDLELMWSRVATALDPEGSGLLLTGSFKALADANWGSIAVVTFIAVASIMALVTGFQGWLYRNAGPVVRLMLITSGFLLVYPERWSRIAGFCLILISMAVQLAPRRRALA